MDLKEIGLIILMGIGLLAIVTVGVVIFTFAWNEVMPFLFGLPTLDYVKTIMLWIVVKVLLDLGKVSITIKHGKKDEL